MKVLDVKVEYIYHSGFTVETEDHFLVFDYYQGDIKYIFSDDIETESDRVIYFLRAYKTLLLDDLEIKTFSSTDLGVSFLVKVDGISIFFAGDLNWWSWNSDTQKERDTMEYLFKKKIDRIDEENIDIAFFPVDPRLEENYYLGGEYFIENLHPEYFFPMHFGDNYSKTKCLST